MSTKQGAARKEAAKLNRWREHESRVGPDRFSYAVGYFGIVVLVGMVAAAVALITGVI